VIPGLIALARFRLRGRRPISTEEAPR